MKFAGVGKEASSGSRGGNPPSSRLSQPAALVARSPWSSDEGSERLRPSMDEACLRRARAFCASRRCRPRQGALSGAPRFRSPSLPVIRAPRTPSTRPNQAIPCAQLTRVDSTRRSSCLSLLRYALRAPQRRRGPAATDRLLLEQARASRLSSSFWINSVRPFDPRRRARPSGSRRTATPCGDGRPCSKKKSCIAQGTRGGRSGGPIRGRRRPSCALNRRPTPIIAIHITGSGAYHAPRTARGLNRGRGPLHRCSATLSTHGGGARPPRMLYANACARP